MAADDAPGSDLVAGPALREARLRKLPVLASELHQNISYARAAADLLTFDRRDMARWRPDRGPMALPPPAVSENSGGR